MGHDKYTAMNERLGIDEATGEGDWPVGLEFHASGATVGGWTVFEVWESKDAQHRFMEYGLGRALQEGGVTEPPSRVEWVDLAARKTLS